MTEEHLYSIALRKCKWVGDHNFMKLIRAAGSAKEAWHLSKKAFQKIDGVGNKTVSDIGNTEHLKFAENELGFCEKNKIKILLRSDANYPELLNECDDAPAILYLKGQLQPQTTKFSMVGTRNMTFYGKEFVQDFFKEVKNTNVASVSGLALGVDAEVHQQSIENNIPSIAVLAHGFHTLYPSKNRKLSEKILSENGALVSEFNSSQKPDRENFIQRNRVIAGLSETTIVVETAFGGGSVSTVSFANQYNRDVYALPGSIKEKYSQGCNLVISQNKAHIISSPQNLVEILGFSSNKTGSLFSSKDLLKQLTETERKIYNCIKAKQKISIDEIAVKCDHSTYQLLPILLDLELSGHIRSLSGRQYVTI